VAELEKSGKAVISRKVESGVFKGLFQTLIVDRDPIISKQRQALKLAKQNNKMWLDTLECYLAHVQLWRQKRSLILSEGGYIVLAPFSTLPDDGVCILHGFHAPVILRPRGDGSYTFMGDAYIHALRDGEAFAPGRTANYRREELVIR
jgi:hypothetical protein